MYRALRKFEQVIVADGVSMATVPQLARQIPN